MGEFELVTLQSGIKSLRSCENGETFHPVTGPRVEADILHVRQQRLRTRCSQSVPFVIWDVGFGAGANVLAAIEALKDCPTEVHVHSFDRTTGPIEFALRHADALDYLAGHEPSLRRLIADREAAPAPNIRWQLHLGDFRDQVRDERRPPPNAIFYDPYSPSVNVEMWTLDHFRRLRERLAPESPCLLTNYTCSTAARTTLLLAGFNVGVGRGVGEKVETTIASNELRLLERPLTRDWLRRVRASHSAAPLRGPEYLRAPISDGDFACLQDLPQFGAA